MHKGCVCVCVCVFDLVNRRKKNSFLCEVFPLRSQFVTLMLNEKYYITDFLVQFLLLLIRPIDWIGCSIILESKHPGRRIGSTFNGQYLGAGLLIPSILN